MEEGGSSSTGNVGGWHSENESSDQASECATITTSHITEYPVYLTPQEEGGYFHINLSLPRLIILFNYYIFAEKHERCRHTPIPPRTRTYFPQISPRQKRHIRDVWYRLQLRFERLRTYVNGDPIDIVCSQHAAHSKDTNRAFANEVVESESHFPKTVIGAMLPPVQT